MFNEISALFGSPNLCTAIAREEATLLSVGSQDLRTVFYGLQDYKIKPFI